MRQILLLWLFLSCGCLFGQRPQYTAQPALSFTMPGIIGVGGGGFVGSDHLLNLTSDIFVIVDIVKPADLNITVTEQEIREAVLNRFWDEGLEVYLTADRGPPLPYFNVLVMVQKVEGGYVASCQGRLFESVTLKRVILPADVFFQAITWEKTTLIVTPTEKLNEHIITSVNEITNTFLARYKFFEKQRDKLKRQIQG